MEAREARRHAEQEGSSLHEHAQWERAVGILVQEFHHGDGANGRQVVRKLQNVALRTALFHYGAPQDDDPLENNGKNAVPTRLDLYNVRFVLVVAKVLGLLQPRHHLHPKNHASTRTPSWHQGCQDVYQIMASLLARDATLDCSATPMRHEFWWELGGCAAATTTTTILPQRRTEEWIRTLLSLPSKLLACTSRQSTTTTTVPSKRLRWHETESSLYRTTRNNSSTLGVETKDGEEAWMVSLSYLLCHVLVGLQQSSSVSSSWKQVEEQVMCYALATLQLSRAAVHAGVAAFLMDSMTQRAAFPTTLSFLHDTCIRTVVHLLLDDNHTCGGGCFVSPVISLMARLSGIPRRNYVAKCANVLYTYQLEYSTPDAIQAVLDLIQQGNPGESAEMYLAHHSSSRTRKDRREKKQNHPTAGLLLSPDAKTNVRMENETTGPTTSKRKRPFQSIATDKENDQEEKVAPLERKKQRILSPAYPLLLEIKACVTNGNVQKAVVLARLMERSTILSQQEKREAWFYVLDYLHHTDQLLLVEDNHANVTALVTIAAGMGSTGVTAVLDFLHQIVLEVRQPPQEQQEGGLEWVRHVERAAEKTALKLLLSKPHDLETAVSLAQEVVGSSERALQQGGTIQERAFSILNASNPMPRTRTSQMTSTSWAAPESNNTRNIAMMIPPTTTTTTTHDTAVVMDASAVTDERSLTNAMLHTLEAVHEHSATNEDEEEEAEKEEEYNRKMQDVLEVDGSSEESEESNDESSEGYDEEAPAVPEEESVVEIIDSSSEEETGSDDEESGQDEGSNELQDHLSEESSHFEENEEDDKGDFDEEEEYEDEDEGEDKVNIDVDVESEEEDDDIEFVQERADSQTGMVIDGDEKTRQVVVESKAPLYVDYDEDGNEDASEEAVDDESEVDSSDATAPVENGDKEDDHIVQYQDPTANIDTVAREREFQHDEGYDPDTLPTEGEEEEGFTEEEEEQIAKDEAMIDSSMLHNASSSRESNEMMGDDEDTVQMDMDEKEAEDTILEHQSLDDEILHERVANTEDEVDGTSSGQEASDNQSSADSVSSADTATSGNTGKHADEDSKEDIEEHKDILMEPEEKAADIKDDAVASDALPSAILLQHDITDENKQTDVEENIETDDKEGNKQADEESKEDGEDQKGTMVEPEEKAADIKDDVVASDTLPSATSLQHDVTDESKPTDVIQNRETDEEGNKQADEESKEAILMESEDKVADIKDDVVASGALPSSTSLQHDVTDENKETDVEENIETDDKEGNKQADEESKEDVEEQKDVLMESEEKAADIKDDVVASDALLSSTSSQHDVTDENKETDVEQNIENDDKEGNKQADEQSKEDDEEQIDTLMEPEEKAVDTEDDLLASDALPSAISLKCDVTDENNHLDAEQNAENDEKEGSKHATEDTKEENEEQKNILMDLEENVTRIEGNILASDSLPSSILLHHDGMNVQSDGEQKEENEKERHEGTMHVSTAAKATPRAFSDAASFASSTVCYDDTSGAVGMPDSDDDIMTQNDEASQQVGFDNSDTLSRPTKTTDGKSEEEDRDQSAENERAIEADIPEPAGTPSKSPVGKLVDAAVNVFSYISPSRFFAGRVSATEAATVPLPDASSHENVESQVTSIAKQLEGVDKAEDKEPHNTQKEKTDSPSDEQSVGDSTKSGAITKSRRKRRPPRRYTNHSDEGTPMSLRRSSRHAQSPESHTRLQDTIVEEKTEAVKAEVTKFESGADEQENKKSQMIRSPRQTGSTKSKQRSPESSTRRSTRKRKSPARHSPSNDTEVRSSRRSSRLNAVSQEENTKKKSKGPPDEEASKVEISTTASRRTTTRPLESVTSGLSTPRASSRRKSSRTLIPTSIEGKASENSPAMSSIAPTPPTAMRSRLRSRTAEWDEESLAPVEEENMSETNESEVTKKPARNSRTRKQTARPPKPPIRTSRRTKKNALITAETSVSSSVQSLPHSTRTRTRRQAQGGSESSEKEGSARVTRTKKRGDSSVPDDDILESESSSSEQESKTSRKSRIQAKLSSPSLERSNTRRMTRSSGNVRLTRSSLGSVSHDSRMVEDLLKDQAFFHK